MEDSSSASEEELSSEEVERSKPRSKNTRGAAAAKAQPAARPSRAAAARGMEKSRKMVKESSSEESEEESEEKPRCVTMPTPMHAFTVLLQSGHGVVDGHGAPHSPLSAWCSPLFHACPCSERPCRPTRGLPPPSPSQARQTHSTRRSARSWGPPAR